MQLGIIPRPRSPTPEPLLEEISQETADTPHQPTPPSRHVVDEGARPAEVSQQQQTPSPKPALGAVEDLSHEDILRLAGETLKGGPLKEVLRLVGPESKGLPFTRLLPLAVEKLRELPLEEVLQLASERLAQVKASTTYTLHLNFH